MLNFNDTISLLNIRTKESLGCTVKNLNFLVFKMPKVLKQWDP